MANGQMAPTMPITGPSAPSAARPAFPVATRPATAFGTVLRATSGGDPSNNVDVLVPAGYVAEMPDKEFHLASKLPEFLEDPMKLEVDNSSSELQGTVASESSAAKIEEANAQCKTRIPRIPFGQTDTLYNEFMDNCAQVTALDSEQLNSEAEFYASLSNNFIKDQVAMGTEPVDRALVEALDQSIVRFNTSGLSAASVDFDLSESEMTAASVNEDALLFERDLTVDLNTIIAVASVPGSDVSLFESSASSASVQALSLCIALVLGLFL
jgi:hypothetical protein